MKTRFITIGLLTSLSLLVAACSSNPVTSENEWNTAYTDANFVSGESEQSGNETDFSDSSSSLSKNPVIIMAASQSATHRQALSNEYLTESVSNAYLQKPFAQHDYSQFTLPVVGQSDTTVIQNYGQPTARHRGSNGVDMWDYGSFRVVFRNNAVSNASMWRMQHLNG